MKISNYIYAGAAKAYGGSNVKNKENIALDFADVLDTVEISADGKNYIGRQQYDARADKVNSIKEKVNSGRYIFDPEITASNMLAAYLY